MRATWTAVAKAVGYLVVTLGATLVSLVMLAMTAIAVLTAPAGRAGPLPLWVRAVNGWARWHRTRAALHLGAPAPPSPDPETDPERILRAPSTRRLARWLPSAVLLGVPGGLLGLTAALLPPASLRFPFWWALPEEPVFLWLPVNDPATAACATAGQLIGGLVLLRWAPVPAARVHARLTLARLTPSRAELLTARARTAPAPRPPGPAGGTPDGRPEAAALTERDHEDTEAATAELRELIRGIHPQAPTGRGLLEALDSLAGRTPVPVRLDTADPGHLPAAVESAAYFAVTEAVADAVRHGPPTAVDVRLARDGDVLRLRVADDGPGGVDGEHRTGVRGIRHRVAALDGTVRVSSPAGGPTVLSVELPCGP